MERKDVTDELIASLEEASAILVGDTPAFRVWVPPAHVDVRAIRDRLGLSQTAFARRFGFSPSAVREWEQGRRQPEAAARVLLLVIDRNPAAVDDAIQADTMRAA